MEFLDFHSPLILPTLTALLLLVLSVISAFRER